MGENAVENFLFNPWSVSSILWVYAMGSRTKAKPGSGPKRKRKRPIKHDRFSLHPLTLREVLESAGKAKPVRNAELERKYR